MLEHTLALINQLIMPILIIVSLTLFALAMAPDDANRIIYCITVFLIMSVFKDMTAGMVPQVSATPSHVQPWFATGVPSPSGPLPPHHPSPPRRAPDWGVVVDRRIFALLRLFYPPGHRRVTARLRPLQVTSRLPLHEPCGGEPGPRSQPPPRPARLAPQSMFSEGRAGRCTSG